MVTHQCFKEKTNGYCDKSGVVAYLLSRDRNVPIEEEDTLKELLQKSCLRVKDWKIVTSKKIKCLLCFLIRMYNATCHDLSKAFSKCICDGWHSMCVCSNCWLARDDQTSLYFSYL